MAARNVLLVWDIVCYGLCFIGAMVVEQDEVMQAVQAEQWRQDMHDLEVKAATWCQDQVQSVHREKEQAVAAVQTKCDAWLVATPGKPVCQYHLCHTVLQDRAC